MHQRIVSRFQQPRFTVMTTSQIPTFLHRIEITPGDIDDMDHVNNAVYLRWAQETVVLYWQHVSSIDAQE